MRPADFLRKAGIRPLKSMDQFFLRDEYLEKEVALAQLSPSDVVLEIGAGYGNLTRRIAERAPVVAIEADSRFLPHLEKLDNAEIVIADAAKEIEHRSFNKAVANLPYSRSQELLIALLRHGFERAVLCVSEAVAQKMLGSDKLGMLFRSCCSVRVALDVPGKAFYPAAVASSIIVIEQHSAMDADFWEFLKKIYRRRNANAGKLVPGTRFAKRKINSLTYSEIRALFEESR